MTAALYAATFAAAALVVTHSWAWMIVAYLGTLAILVLLVSFDDTAEGIAPGETQ